jgi:hypothetical protein
MSQRAVEFAVRWVGQHFPSGPVLERDDDLRRYLSDMIGAAEQAGIGRGEFVEHRGNVQRTITAALKVAAAAGPTLRRAAAPGARPA